MSLHPNTLEPGDRVTIIHDGRALRGTFSCHSTNGSIRFSIANRPPGWDSTYADEGVWWIRGWPDRNGREVKAMLAAQALLLPADSVKHYIDMIYREIMGKFPAVPTQGVTL